jgi:hypothetical protein
MRKDNYEYAVNCVNVHDDLIAALRAASNAIGPCSTDFPLVRQIAAALAKATSQPQ